MSGNSFETWRHAERNMPSDIFLKASVSYSHNPGRQKIGTHDVCFMNSRDTFSAARLRIMKCISGNAFRCIPGDKLDRLHYAIYDLEEKRVGI